MSDEPENINQDSKENPNAEGIQAAMRFPLYVFIFGVGMGVVGIGISIEWISVAGFSIAALGGSSYILLKLLYGSEITEK
ncbi:MAG: hypothetical protein OQJ97_13475 [Rhodospirillales bacterium]|nr:hypothetical protein [Rhodospirillales bacterium]